MATAREQGTARAAPAAEGHKGKQLVLDKTSPSPGFAGRQPRDTQKLSLESALVSAPDFFHGNLIQKLLFPICTCMSHFQGSAAPEPAQPEGKGKPWGSLCPSAAFPPTIDTFTTLAIKQERNFILQMSVPALALEGRNTWNPWSSHTARILPEKCKENMTKVRQH